MTLTVTHRPADVAVRRASAHEASALGRVLARAFYDDPVCEWLIPRHDVRQRRLERFFGRVTVPRVALPGGEVRTTPALTGVALWMPPGSLGMSTRDELMMLPAMVRASGRDLRRVMRALGAMEAVHPHEPHWYLPLLGVLPGRQGQGIGSALLRSVLDRCDEDGAPAYLEATSPRNRELYLRHGFEVRDVLTLPAGGPPLWLMWRDPS